jgi:GST-like protein
LIHLYSSISPNVQKIIIALEELNLQYELISINVHRSQQFTSEFKELNPLGKIPVIIDHDGPGGRPITIFESGAILLYLSERYGGLLPSDLRKRTEIIQWMMFQMTSLGPILGQFNHFVRYAPEDVYGVSRFTTAARNIYDQLEERLSKSAYLGGTEYSIADVATYPWIRVESILFGETHPGLRMDWEGHPHILRWCSLIQQRPAVRKALIHIDAMQSNRGTGTPEDEDRLAGRGAFAQDLQ